MKIYSQKKINTFMWIIVFAMILSVCFNGGRVYQIMQDEDEIAEYKKVIIQLKESLNRNAKLTFEQKARQIARQYDIDEEFVLAIMWQESRFKPNVTSSKGATGLMQLMPNTLKDLGVPVKHSWETNIDAGVRYIKWLQNRGIDGHELLIAYNWGIGNLRKYQNGKVKSLPNETRQYVAKITDHIIQRPWTRL